MDNEPKEKKRQFTISIPITGYPRTMRFNRFCLEPADSFLVAHFGFVSEQGTLLDIYSFAISKEDLKVNRDQTLKYLERVGGAGSGEPERWVAPSDKRGMDMVRIITTSHNGTSAEIALCTFAMTSLSSKMKTANEKSELPVQPVALLGCDAALQKQVLAQLYIQS